MPIPAGYWAVFPLYTSRATGYNAAMPAARPAPNRQDPNPSLRKVKVGDAIIEYRIQFSRKRKKTIQIAVRNEGVVVSAPNRTPLRELRDLVIRRADWILRHQAELEQRQKETPERPALAAGAILPYLGQNLELAIQRHPAEPRAAAAKPRISRQGNQLVVYLPVGADGDGAAGLELLTDAVIDWYRARAEEQIHPAVARWWDALGRGDAPKVRIRTQRRRWGSCAYDGTMRFSWRLAMVEPALTEYVVVHELAHLTYMNHSPRFWQLVAQHLPDAQERRRRLRAVERGLPRL